MNFSGYFIYMTTLFPIYISKGGICLIKIFYTGKISKEELISTLNKLISKFLQEIKINEIKS